MPTNANTFNSRVTSEALEAKFRQVFPAQGGAELVQDLFASGVIQPVIDFSSVAEGTFLPQNLQTAWDFSTTAASQFGAGTTTAISNTGFWQVMINAEINFGGGNPNVGDLELFDGASAKNIWSVNDRLANYAESFIVNDLINVFLRSGDSLRIVCTANAGISVKYRQIADVNGNLVNPLGFTFS